MNSVKLNPFWVNVLCPYPLKTPENQRIFDIFRMYRKETLALNIKGMLRPIFCIDVNTHSDRKSKNYLKFT